MDCSQPPLSIGFSKARILDWVAMPSSWESFQPRDWTYILYLHINRCLGLRLPEETSIKHFTIFFFFLILAAPQGMWDLSSPTMDWTHTPCIARQILYHSTTRQVHILCCNMKMTFVILLLYPHPPLLLSSCSSAKWIISPILLLKGMNFPLSCLVL